MLKVILQKGQGMVEEGGRWAVSVRRTAVSRSAGAKNGFLDGGRAFDTICGLNGLSMGTGTDFLGLRPRCRPSLPMAIVGHRESGIPQADRIGSRFQGIFLFL